MNDKQIEYNSQFMGHFATKTANIHRAGETD